MLKKEADMINTKNKNQEGNRIFIIAEIGSNHDQEIDIAFELMDIAKKCGADAVKFQSLNLDKVIAREDIAKADIDLFEHIKLKEEWYEEIFQYANKIGIECLSCPTYLDAVDLLIKAGAQYMKIASPQTYGFPEIIKRAAQSGIKTIMSTGYCNLDEIRRAVNYYAEYGDINNLSLLHCVSQYPTEIKNVNLNFIKKLKQEFAIPIGFSDHTEGTAVSVAAAALGAQVIEKHITISRASKGPDHFFALEPYEFERLVKEIRTVVNALGNGVKTLCDYEIRNREQFIAYPYANCDIKSGEEIKENQIAYYRSKTSGVSPWNVHKTLIGTKTASNVSEGSKFIE